MKKHMLASLFILMILFIAALPCSAAESTADTLTYENFEYHSNGSGITIDFYFGTEKMYFCHF